MTSKKEIIDFYDGQVDYQVKAAYNDRHRLLFEKLKSAGLHSGSHLLDIGCNIGVLSLLASQVVKEGSITGVDLSPASIAVAEKNNRAKNVRFIASDIFEYRHEGAPADFIIIFDVLEHIPTAQHDELFRRLAGWLAPGGRILINIPNPAYLEYLEQKNAEELQIVDLPVNADELIPTAARHGIVLQEFHTQDIWVKGDYQFILFARKEKFEEIPVVPQANLKQRLTRFLKRKG